MAIAAGLSAFGAARAVVALDAMQRAPNAQAAVATTADGAAQPGAADAALAGAPMAASLVKAADGHYWAEATVNGQRIHFLVDTGATVVALTPTDAERLGIQPASLTYNANVSTANGQARGAGVKLTRVSVGSTHVDDVDALVIDKGLSTSLLGMSYLGRLSRFEATPQALILRQ